MAKDKTKRDAKNKAAAPCSNKQNHKPHVWQQGPGHGRFYCPGK